MPRFLAAITQATGQSPTKLHEANVVIPHSGMHAEYSFVVIAFLTPAPGSTKRIRILNGHFFRHQGILQHHFGIKYKSVMRGHPE